MSRDISVPLYIFHPAQADETVLRHREKLDVVLIIREVFARAKSL